jgi:hypothetical protein
MQLTIVQTGETAELGKEYADFRGDLWTLEGGKPPHKTSSSGFVWARDSAGRSREFYPFVIGMTWGDEK